MNPNRLPDTSTIPADEALYLGAALAHVAAFYERQRRERIERQNRMAYALARSVRS